MEIEVGDYIRDNHGIIAKVRTTNSVIIEAIINTGAVKVYLEEEISKHSKNIIDLIEVGDIIEVINRDESKEDATKIELFDEAGFYDEMIDHIKRKEFRVLSILTHEQYERNCFRMEGK